jgi:hypothetical protein
MTKDEALKKALNDLILEYHMETSSFAKRVDEIFEQALAAPVQPVAWRWVNPKGWLTYGEAPHDTFKSTPLYTNPPAAQRPWVGLTDEERDDLLDNYITAEGRARAIEAKLKEKNAAAQPEQEEDLYDLAVKADNWGQP